MSKKVPSKKEYLKGLEKLGFVIKTGKHYKVTYPNHPGIMVVVSCTASDKNAVRQSIREMKRKFRDVQFPW